MFKIIRLLLILFFCILLPRLSISAAVEDGFTPGLPVRLPISDNHGNPLSELRLDYLHYDHEYFRLNGMSIAYNYISPLGERSDWVFNLGFGVNYLKGESLSIETNGFTLPGNVNIGYNLLKNKNIPALTVFGGFHTSYTYLFIESDEGVEFNIPQWGPLCGILATVRISESVAFIPYYVFKNNRARIDTYIEDSSWSRNSVNFSHLTGFDLLISEFSLGAALDFTDGLEGKLIIITIAQKF